MFTRNLKYAHSAHSKNTDAKIYIPIRFVDFSNSEIKIDSRRDFPFIFSLIYIIQWWPRTSVNHFFPLGSGNIISSHKRMGKCFICIEIVISTFPLSIYPIFFCKVATSFRVFWMILNNQYESQTKKSKLLFFSSCNF